MGRVYENYIKKQGTKVKFNNAIIILTSNLGANEAYREDSFGLKAKRTICGNP